MTIYNLMNTRKGRTILFYLGLAKKEYKEGNKFYWTYENQAYAALETLECAEVLDYEEYIEVGLQINRVMRLYKGGY